MIRNLLIILVFSFTSSIYAQIDGQLLLGLTNATTSEMNAISNPIIGSVLYNTTKKDVYTYTGSLWEAAGNSNPIWELNGNSGTNSTTDFIGTTDAQDFILKSNNTESLRLNKDNGQILINEASVFKDHPLVIKANGVDILAFEDNTGTPKWHWNLLSNGLNFVETGVADYRLFLENDGNIGIGTSDPEYKLEVSGSAKIEDTPTIINSNKFLAKDPDTGQISEQDIVASFTNGKFFMNFSGRAYYYATTWYGPNDSYGMSYVHWNTAKGTGTTPTYSTSSQYGVPITSNVNLSQFTIKNDFNVAVVDPTINLSVIRNGAIINIGTYEILESTTNTTIQTTNVSFILLEGDLLVWATKGTVTNRFSYTSLTFEFTY